MLITDLLFNEVKANRLDKEEVRGAIRNKAIQYLQLRKLRNKREVTQTFLKEVDLLLGKKLDREPEVSKKIACYKGCASCCHSRVTVTEDEAALLVHHAHKHRISIDTVRMNAQKGVAATEWKNIPVADQRCIFLTETGTCSVYEVRPGVCRKHLVTSEPGKCNANAALSELERIFDYQAEVLISSMWQITQTGNMADMVSAQLQKGH